MGPDNRNCVWVKDHDGDPNCFHSFKIGLANILTYPVTVHLTCSKCGRRECRKDQPTDKHVDMVFYGSVTVKAPKL